MTPLANPAQLRPFPHDVRKNLRVLAGRVEWLTDQIQIRAARGQPVDHYRRERKALRWALERAGVELVPNPEIPGCVADEAAE